MSSIAKTVAEIPLQFMQCRGFRHQVRFITDNATKGPGGKIIEFSRTMRCDACGLTIKSTYSVPDFRLVKRPEYDYPDNYRVKGGLSIYDARLNYVTNRFR